MEEKPAQIMSKRKLCEFFESTECSIYKKPNEFVAAEKVAFFGEDSTVCSFHSKGVHVEYISERSWIAVIKGFLPPEDTEFDELWESHPTDFKSIKMFGKDVKLPRYQQAYGRSYQYSGIESRAIAETPLINRLKDRLNELISTNNNEPTEYVFNMCLCNWYEPEHYIGPHSDDKRQLVPQSPIAGLSWGCPRVFTLSPKTLKSKARKKSITMESGDLIIMGGDCQVTHKHEIEKLKRGDRRGNRVSFTFRCFR